MSSVNLFEFLAVYPEAEYVVVFTSQAAHKDAEYMRLNSELEEIVSRLEGFLGMQSLSKDGQGISLSYWASSEAIAEWRNQEQHKLAKSKSSAWYEFWSSYICKIEKSNFHKNI